MFAIQSLGGGGKLQHRRLRCGPALFYARIVAPFSSGYVKLSHYFARLMARSSVKRVIKEAWPYFHYFPLHSDIPAHFLCDAEPKPQ